MMLSNIFDPVLAGVCKKGHTFDVGKRSFVFAKIRKYIRQDRRIYSCPRLLFLANQTFGLLSKRKDPLGFTPFLYVTLFLRQSHPYPRKTPYRDFFLVCFKFFIRVKNLKCLASIILSFLLFI